MVRVLLSQAAAEQLKDQWPVLEKESGTQIELVEVRNERLDERADVAYFAAVDYRNEIYIDSMMSSAANGSLKWAHIAWVGADRQIFSDLAEHGVEITNSAGYNAVAIANTVIGAILSLARGFHHVSTPATGHRLHLRSGRTYGENIFRVSALCIDHRLLHSGEMHKQQKYGGEDQNGR